MTHSVMEQMGEQIDETACKASKAASAVADAFEDGVGAARCAVKHGSQAATELYVDTRRHVQQHPVKSVAATFAVGIATGAAIGWMVGRR
jgi:ElaB/YqjD/DUF883 family membrane-anchored ribosome-binding protein